MIIGTRQASRLPQAELAPVRKRSMMTGGTRGRPGTKVPNWRAAGPGSPNRPVRRQDDPIACPAGAHGAAHRQRRRFFGCRWMPWDCCGLRAPTLVTSRQPGAAGLTGGMFVSEEQTLTVSFAVAASRLARLAGAGWLREVSETVYQGGVEYLMRVGPAGTTPGVSRRWCWSGSPSRPTWTG